MIDLSKFIDYPMWFKIAVFTWLALTLFLGATSLFIKPEKKDVKVETQTTTQKLEEPRFSETIESFSFSLGERGITAGYSKEALEKKHMQPFNFADHSPVELYIEDDNLYADVKIYGGSGLPSIEIKQNKLSNKPHDWDFNSNKKAMEIVDKNQNPIYQFFYKSPSHIVVNGVFPFPGGLILANDEGALINPSFPTTFKLKRIFKYPSWKYPGEYENQ